MKITRNLIQTPKPIRLSHYLTGFAIFLGAIASASAQNQASSGVNYVTVYEDCDFRGKSRSLALGDYNEITRINIRNDSISSMQIPSGLQITVYEHESLRGDKVTFNSNVRCLNKRWNDEISSVRVSKTNGVGNLQNQNNTNELPYGNPQPQSSGYGEQYNSGAEQNFTKDVSRIWFANTILKKGNDRYWRISNPNGTVDTFTELKRYPQVIFLRNNANGQNVTVDLRANNIRFMMPQGQPVDYAISRSEKGKNTGQANNSGSSGVIDGGCFSYRAYSRGGAGGLRFHGHDGFKEFANKGVSGRICHEGALTMEINKKSPSTEVVVEINGRNYRFNRNEEATSLKNTWYRKLVKLRVNR